METGIPKLSEWKQTLVFESSDFVKKRERKRFESVNDIGISFENSFFPSSFAVIRVVFENIFI